MLIPGFSKCSYGSLACDAGMQYTCINETQEEPGMGKCQWKDCEREATKNRYRSVNGIVKDPVTKKRIWFEHCHVCNKCDKEASKEYIHLSFVKPYEK